MFRGVKRQEKRPFGLYLNVRRLVRPRDLCDLRRVAVSYYEATTLAGGDGVSLYPKLRRFHFNLLLAVQRLLFEHVLVLGDSHARVFARPSLRRRLWRHHFHVLAVPGATASGLENPDSKTQALPQFEQALACSKARRVIVLLGEIDAGFVIWYRAQKYGSSVSVALEQVCTTYGTFLKTLQQRGFTAVCISAPLPTIEDDNDWGEVASLRRSVRATQRQRTELTLSFNYKMAAFCRAENIVHINLDRDSLAENELVDPALLSGDRLDHHYDYQTYAALLAKPVAHALREVGARAAPVILPPTAFAPRENRPRQLRRYHRPSHPAPQERRPR